MMKKNSYFKFRLFLPILSIFIMFLFLVHVEIVKAELLSVNGDKVNLRTGPGSEYVVKWEYGNGLPLTVLKKKGKWVKVEDFEGDSGWVHRSLLADKPHMIVKVNRNKNNGINIRKQPGTKKKIIGKAYYGVVFKTIEQRSGWVKVQHSTGLEGWVKRTLLWGY